MSDILFELGFEEMPVEELKILANHFTTQISDTMKNNDICDEIQYYVTPRRIALIMENAPAQTPSETVEMKGPPLNVMFDSGNALTKQGRGFLKSKGLNEKDIIRKDNAVYYKAVKGGHDIIDVLKKAITDTVKNVPFKKTMKWPGSDMRFSRPIRWMLFIKDAKTVDFVMAGIRSANISYGNRNAGNKALIINAIDDYANMLDANHVILDEIYPESMTLVNKRYGMIQDGIKNINEGNNLHIGISDAGTPIDAELIEENALLTEYPRVLLGAFDNRFTDMPAPIIKAALKQHQRYFYAEDSHHFAFVTNQPNSELDSEIVHNNEKIITARLEDAEFYFHADMKRSMDDYSSMLDNTVFYAQLGTYGDKMKRIAALALHMDSLLERKNTDFEELALICKFDIATDMIKDGKEFTKLQGEIGYQYAVKMDLDRNKALCAREHYMPRTKNDSMPSTYESILLSIADKADNIAGAFIAGHKPTGSKDVMGVRRDVLALVYMMYRLSGPDYERFRDISRIDIRDILETAITQYGKEHLSMIEDILTFIKDRIEVEFQNYGYSIDALRTVLASLSLNVFDIQLKCIVINDIRLKRKHDFITLITGIKRVNNILRSAEYEENNSMHVSDKYEKALYDAALNVAKDNETLYKDGKFGTILENFLSMRGVIDEFFDNVMVMDEDKDKRNTRLNLLAFVQSGFEQFGDFSQIVIEGTNNIDT